MFRDISKPNSKRFCEQVGIFNLKRWSVINLEKQLTRISLISHWLRDDFVNSDWSILKELFYIPLKIWLKVLFQVTLYPSLTTVSFKPLNL